MLLSTCSILADVDECLTSPCDTNANCTNAVGSYTCQCQDGYTGDGLSCAGKRLLKVANWVVEPKYYWKMSCMSHVHESTFASHKPP